MSSTLGVFRTWWEDLKRVPPSSFVVRALLACALTVGIGMTAFGSIFLRETGPIPLPWFPDARILMVLTTGLWLGLWGAFGGAPRRKFALWGAIGVVIAFHLEEATVHWIGPIPGSITGARVGILGTAGSLLALASVLLLHVEVERVRLALDVEKRGAPPAEAWNLAARLGQEGTRRIVVLATVTAGLGALVWAGEAVLGDDGSGGVWVLFVGGALLFALALFLGRVMRPRAA